MPNNRAKTEIDQKSFLDFVFMGKEPPQIGKVLTPHQQKVYARVKEGLTHREIAEAEGFTLGSVYDSVGKIRFKGWVL